MTPRSLYLTIAGHEIHVTEWGPADAPAVVMWHGLARTGRDFDTAACSLAERYRVVCPDTVGRGLSSWSKNPDDYTVPAYTAHAVELLDKLGVGTCRWVGTSMGGLIGMAAAAGPLKERITRLVLNDVGPHINPVAIERIKAYVTMIPDFATMAEYENFIRLIYSTFGRLSDMEWRRMAETSARRRDDGRITVHYDPLVMQVVANDKSQYDGWPLYDAIAVPTLVVRGAKSDLLLAETADEMTRRGPKARLATIEECGHAPALNTPEQIALLEEFLR